MRPSVRVILTCWPAHSRERGSGVSILFVALWQKSMAIHDIRLVLAIPQRVEFDEKFVE